MSEKEQRLLQKKILSFIQQRTAQKKMVDYSDVCLHLQMHYSIVYNAIETLVNQGKLIKKDFTIGALLEPARKSF